MSNNHNKGFDDPRTLRKALTSMRMNHGVLHNSQIGMNKLVFDKEYLYQQHTVQAKTINKIAKELEVDFKTVESYIKRYNIKRGFDPYGPDNTEYVITLRKNNTDKAIAKELGITVSALHYRFRRCGLSMAVLPKETTELLTNKEFMHTEYVKNKRTSTDIANDLNCTYQTVINHLRKHNIRIRGILSKAKHKLLNDYDWMYEHYITKKLNTRKISKIVGCTHKTINDYLQTHNIELRPNMDQWFKDNLKG